MKKLDSVKWPIMLGGEEFNQRIKEKLRGKEIDVKEITGYGTRRERVEAFKQETKRLIEAKKDAAKNVRTRSEVLERRAVIYLLRLYGKTLNEIGGIMGSVSYVSISRQLKKTEEEVNSKAGCYLDVKKIKEPLTLLYRMTM